MLRDGLPEIGSKLPSAQKSAGWSFYFEFSLCGLISIRMGDAVSSVSRRKRQSSAPHTVSQIPPSSVPPPPHPDFGGSPTAEHELLRPIAAGAYGEVWLARNAIGTLRAMKIVRRDQHAAAESFEREFKGLQRFEPVSRSHHGLVDILTLGLLKDSAGFYYVMELADDVASQLSGGRMPVSRLPTCPNEERLGHSLPALGYSPRTLRAELKARGALPANEVIALGLKLTAALAYLHAQGLVHRDVKPSNILFIDGEPKLADAGLVADMEDARSLVGTAGYIAPEGPGTPQADIYALGKVLYEAAFGKDRQEFPSLPADVSSRADHAELLELNAVLLRACATNSAQRYPNADGMANDLECLLRGHSVRRKHLFHRCRAFSRKAALLFVLLALLSAVTATLTRREAIGEVQSRIPRVNKLVAEGDACLLSTTPKQLEQALAFFEEAIKLDPRFVPAYFGIHRVYVASGNLEGSRSITPKLLDLAPDSAEAEVALAYQFWIDWRFQEALQAARRATERPAYTRRAKSRAHLVYGFQLLQSGQPEAALAQYRIAERIAAQLSLPDPVLEHHLGHPHFARRNFALALKHYERSLKIEDRHSMGHYWMGRTYEAMGDFGRAIDEFQTANLSVGTDASETKKRYDKLRAAALEGGRAGYWRQQLQLALEKNERDLYYIATVYAQLGEMDNAYKTLSEACERKSFTQGLMFDLCWNHDDQRFKAITKRIRLVPDL